MHRISSRPRRRDPGRGRGLVHSDGSRSARDRRSLLLPLLAFALVAPALLTHPDHAEAQAAKPPDVVLIITDDQRWDTLQWMPHVQELLVGPGMTFTNGFVVNPLCCPSRASILTGQYAHTTGVYGAGQFESFRDESTIATWLDAAGYRTGLIGKYINGYQDATLVPPGWDRWLAFADPDGPGYYDYLLSDQGTATQYGSGPEDYSTDVFADEAIRFIRDTPAAEPLLLYFAPRAPHRPAIPAPRHVDSLLGLEPFRPPAFDERNVNDKPAYVRLHSPMNEDKEARIDDLRRSQLESLQAVDEAIRAIIDELAAAGRLSHTLIFFTADNGFLLGEHRLLGKLVPYEESIRVPFVVRYDAAVTAPGSIEELALNIDLAPTIVDVSGTQSDISFDGRSLAPLLVDPAGDWRTMFLVEHDRYPDVPAYCALRTGTRLFVRYATGEEELYNLVRDPAELVSRLSFSGISTLRDELRELCAPLPPGMTPF